MLSNIPLRLILIVPFVAQITAAVGLTAWLSIRNGHRAVHDVATQLLGEVGTLTRDRILTYLETPQQLNAIHVNDVELGQIDVMGDVRALSPFLVRSLQIFDSVSFTVLATPQGEYIGAQRQADDSLQIGVIDGATAGSLQYYSTNDQGDFLQLLQEIDLAPGDVLKRPWYEAAVAAQAPTWSAVYTTRSTESLAITAARPIYGDRGDLLAVFSTTIALEQIDQFLNTIKVGQMGQVYIVDGAGRLIATSTGEQLYRVVTRDGVETKELLQATDSQDPLTRAAAKALLDQVGPLAAVDRAQNFELATHRGQEFVAVTPLPDYADLDWHIVVVAPEADFMAQIHANQRNTIWLCLGALALATGSSILTARWITRPLLQLNQAAKDITQGSLQSAQLPEAVVTHRTRELSELSHSFGQMTQQLQAAFAALQTSEANFRNIAANVPGAIFRYILRPDGTDAVLYMSPGCYQLWEIEAHLVEQDASLLWQVVDPEDLPAMQASVMESARTLETWNCEWRITTPSGRRKWLQAVGQPTQQPDGVVLWHTVILDVSDRKTLEQELLEQQQLLNAFVTSSPVAKCIMDNQLRYTLINNALADINGVPAADHIGKTPWDIVPDIADQQTEKMRQVLNTGEAVLDFEVVGETPKIPGVIRTWSASYFPLMSSAGLPMGIGMVVIETTASRQAEQALRESELKFRQLAENIQEVFWLTDAEIGQTFFVSSAYEDIWGRSRESLYADPTSFMAAIHPDDQPLLKQSLTTPNSAFEVEYRVVQPDGTIRWVWDRGFPIFDDSGKLIRRAGLAQDITERKQAESDRTHLSDVLEASLNEIYLFNGDTLTFEYANQGALQNLGYSLEQFQHMTPLDIKPELSAANFEALLAPLRQGDIPKINFETVHQRADGSRYSVDVHIQLTRYNGQSAFLAIVLDISERARFEAERKQAETQLQDLTDRLGLAVQAAGMGIWEWDIGKNHVHWDEQMFKLYKIHPEDFSNVYDAWLSRVHPDDLAVTAAIEQKALFGKQDYEVEFRIVWPGGTIRHIAAYAIVQRDLEGNPLRMVGASVDISDRKRAEEQLIYRALHDALTDLPSRTLLTKRLESAIQRVHRSRTYHFAVLFLDLDQFKVINDSLGHLIGDQLLVSVAQTLQNLIRPTDLVARWGGDEFVILLEHLFEAQDVIHMAERLLAAFNRPTVIDNQSVFINTSIGIVWGTNTYSKSSDLLRDADIALYQAKSKGRGRYEIFDVEMHIQAVKRMTLEHDLRIAIDQQEFVTYYQPIVDLNTQQIIGFEALIRWQHPTQGFISPADFIPVAEETGLIMPITQWVLRSACDQLVTWQQQFPNLKDLRVSVNLSSQDLRQTTLVENIGKTLNQAGLSAHSLTLEITESMLVENTEDAINLLDQLRNLGVRISIDDFGTGYSSLSYLYNLPADYLKIDQSFVGNMQPGGKNYKIVQAVVSLSDQLQLAAIAEGIENEQQLAWLKELGCELGQGYFFARPLAPEAATDLLAIGSTLQR